MYFNIEDCNKVIDYNELTINEAKKLRDTLLKNNFKEKSEIGKLLILKSVLRDIIALNSKSLQYVTKDYIPACVTINLNAFANKILNTTTKRGKLKLDKTIREIYAYCDSDIDFTKTYNEKEVVELIKQNHLVLENNLPNNQSSVLNYNNGIVSLSYLNECLTSGYNNCSLWMYLFYMSNLYPKTFLDEMYKTSNKLLNSFINGKEKDNKFLQKRKNEIERDLRISGYYEYNKA